MCIFFFFFDLNWVVFFGGFSFVCIVYSYLKFRLDFNCLLAWDEESRGVSVCIFLCIKTCTTHIYKQFIVLSCFITFVSNFFFHFISLNELVWVAFIYFYLVYQSVYISLSLHLCMVVGNCLFDFKLNSIVFVLDWVWIVYLMILILWKLLLHTFPVFGLDF